LSWRINNRTVRIVNYSLAEDWTKDLPKSEWVCLVFDDDSPKRYIDEMSNKVLDSNVSYICCTGENAELVHDMFDEEIVFRDVEDLPLPNHQLMTTFDKDLNEHLWFSIFVAASDEVDIDKVIVLDMTKGLKQERLENAILKIQNEAKKST
jgi:hypothetical protein